ADLELGRHAQLIAEIEALVAQHPLRERLRRHLMLALYRSGRQAEALEVYHATRRTLIEEKGLEPGGELQQLERSILNHDDALQARSTRPKTTVSSAARDELVSPSDKGRAAEHERRKPATVVVCDLADSTGLAERLDPEVLQRVLGAYFEEAELI